MSPCSAQVRASWWHLPAQASSPLSPECLLCSCSVSQGLLANTREDQVYDLIKEWNTVVSNKPLFLFCVFFKFSVFVIHHVILLYLYTYCSFQIRLSVQSRSLQTFVITLWPNFYNRFLKKSIHIQSIIICFCINNLIPIDKHLTSLGVSLEDYLFVYVYVYCQSVHWWVKVSREARKVVLELELEVGGICLTWVLRTELGFSERRQNALTAECFPEPCNGYFLNNSWKQTDKKNRSHPNNKWLFQSKPTWPGDVCFHAETADTVSYDDCSKGTQLLTESQSLDHSSL